MGCEVKRPDDGMRLRLFWADMQRVFLLPLLIVVSVYFYVRLEYKAQKIQDLKHHIELHEALEGHAETFKNAQVVEAKAQQLLQRIDRLERIINHKEIK